MFGRRLGTGVKEGTTKKTKTKIDSKEKNANENMMQAIEIVGMALPDSRPYMGRVIWFRLYSPRLKL